MARTVEEIDGEVEAIQERLKALAIERIGCFGDAEIASLPLDWQSKLADAGREAIRHRCDSGYHTVELELTPEITLYVRADFYEVSAEDDDEGLDEDRA